MPLWKRNLLVVMEIAFYLQFFLWPHPIILLSNLSCTLVKLNFFKLPLSRSFLPKKPLPSYCLWQQIQTPGSGFQVLSVWISLFYFISSPYSPLSLVTSNILPSLFLLKSHLPFQDPAQYYFLTEVFPGSLNTYWTYSLPLIWADEYHLAGWDVTISWIGFLSSTR